MKHEKKKRAVPVRSHMISRFESLSKTLKVESVKLAHDKERFDIALTGNVVLRVNSAELAALKLKVTE